jgi:hypothetical protein
MSIQLWNWLYQTAHVLFVSQFKISWPEHDVWQVTIIKAQFLVVVSAVNLWYPASPLHKVRRRKSFPLIIMCEEEQCTSITVFQDEGRKEGDKGLWQVVEEGVDRELSVIIRLRCSSVNCVSDFKFLVSEAVTTWITTQQTSCAFHLGTNSQSHLWSGKPLSWTRHTTENLSQTQLWHSTVNQTKLKNLIA